MTVTTTTTTNTYTGDGTTTAFSFTFEILETTDIKVIVVTTATGVESVRSIGTGSTNYAVTGTGNVNGGTVTFVTAPTASETVFLMRNMGFTQPTDYRTNDPFPAETHENALDRMALQIQQVSRRLDRALLRPESDTTSGALPHNIDLKGGVLKFNSSSGVPEADSSLTDVATSSANGLMSSSDKAKLDGIEASATTDQTASEILSAIKTVDGASSGLDADLLDGQQGSYYLDASNFSGLGTVATLNVGIGNNNIPKFTSGVSDDDFLKVDGSVIEGRSASEVVSDLGVITADSTTTLTNKTIDASQLSGTVANARLDAQLQDVAGLAVTDGGFIVGDGSNFVLETGATVRTSLGLGTAATLDTGISNTNIPKFTSGVVDDDFLRVNGTDIEGRSATELLSDIGAISTSSTDTLTNKTLTSPTINGFSGTGDGSITGDLTLTSTDTGSAEDPNLKLFRNSSSPANHDNIGTVQFQGKNDADETTTFAEIQSQISDVSDGAEDGILYFQVRRNGTLTSIANVSGSSGRFNISNGDLFLQTAADLVFEGATSNSNETTLTVTDPTADRTITLPDASGTVLLNTGDQSITGDLTLTSTDAGATENPTLDLYRNSSSPAVGDVLGHIDFSGENDADEKIVYAKINSDIADETDGTEDGRLDFQVMGGGSLSERIVLRGDSVTSFFNRDVRLEQNVDLIFEGSTDDDHETTLTVTDPTSDNTIQLPDASGTVALQEQAYQAINAQTGTTYTTVLADGGKLVTLSNGSAITLTIPPNSSVAYPIGTKLDFIQIGAGQVTVAGGTGVTVNSTPTLKFRAQHSGASCIKIATDTWQLVGDLAAS